MLQQFLFLQMLTSLIQLGSSKLLGSSVQHKAVLDLIGLPPQFPGNLECRIRRVHYGRGGAVIDDGSRSGQKQLNCHRFVLSPDEDIEASVGEQMIKGYGAPDAALMHMVADHEWQSDVQAARREALRVNGPTLRLVVRALGFDIVGAGELAIGLGKAIINGPDDVKVIEKSSIKLLPGDPLDIVIDAVRAHAEGIDFKPPTEADFGLIRHVAEAIWTPERIAALHKRWVDWKRGTVRLADPVKLPIEFLRSVEFAERLKPLGNWHPVPTSPELARLN